VLHVDDDDDDALVVRQLLGGIPDAFEIVWASTFEQGLAQMTSHEYDVHLVDYRLGARNGLDLLREYRRSGGRAPVIMLTGQTKLSVDVEAMGSGASDYLAKERLDATILERTIRYALDRARLEAELRGAGARLEERVAERTQLLEAANAALAAEIAERRRIEETLRQVDQRKNEFIATLAHELRNPMAPIRNAADILAHTCEDEAEDRARSRAARKVIERQVAHMVRLIDDLLDLSRITHGKIELRRETVSLAYALEAACETVRPMIAARHQHLSVSMPDEELLIEGDNVRMSQIVANLLANAAKYTEPGGRIALEGRREGNQVVVAISDTGIGLSTEQLEHVFTMFGQGGRARDPVRGGLGIGLALARQLAELHGGSLSAESAGLGKGSTFSVRIPLSHGAASPVPEAPDSLQRAEVPRRVLVVDDNVDAATTLAELLSLSGHETHLAHDGPSAVDAALRLRPDAAILDLGLPGFDGFEVARRIRSEPSLSGIELVALSGWVQEDDRARSRDAGFDEHLAKPVKPGTLERILATVPGLSRPTA